MISLRSYLFREMNEEAESSYRRIISLFMQGIALHAVEGDKSDYERFRADIEQFEKNLSPETPISELLVAAGGAVRTMEDYNRSTTKFVRRQSAELQNMVSMLTQTVISIGSSSASSVNRLQEIEQSLDRTRQVEDIHILKLRLGECLDAVREEASRQRMEGQSTLDVLRQELDSSRDRMGGLVLPPPLDTATGLPGKLEAEKAIRDALDSPEGKFLVVAVISRVQHVNARFGYAVGDRVLGAFAEHFQKSLLSQDMLFRWHGPALMAVLERDQRLEQVRTEIRRFADVKLERTVEIGMRTVLIPISAKWSLFPVVAPLDTLLKKLETFTAAQVPRDYA